ncbi:MAG: hypothetical protein GXO37_03920, partial [Chloroflexi bacterium]|nr:hypothetical protein [Chloroflexota bacterium]
PTGAKSIIEIFNIDDGQITQLAEDGRISGYPLWLPDKQMVWYIAYDLYANPAKNRSRLMAAALGDGRSQLVLNDVTQPLFVMPNNREVVVLGPNRRELIKVDMLTGSTSPLKEMWEFAGRSTRLFQSSQHSSLQRTVLYNDAAFLVLDLTTGATTELSLGKWQQETRWALDARWSPDGRLLAVKVTAGRLPNPYSSLLILDIEKECSWEIPISPPFHIYKMAWSPGGRYLLLSGEVGTIPPGYPIIEHRLLDLATKQERKMNLWDTDTGGAEFEWSPDGKTIITNCATPEGGALCTITVEVKP